MIEEKSLARRSFLKLALLAGAWPLLPSHALAARLPSERILNLHNANTDEFLKIRYYAGGEYLAESLEKINKLLRDHRTGEVKPIDPQLLDYLFAVGAKIKARGPFQIVSGYRSPKTNAALRRRSRGVAKNSYHMYGKAVDFRIPGYRLSYVRRTAVSLRAGGVGYYPRSHFVHIDIGKFRCW